MLCRSALPWILFTTSVPGWAQFGSPYPGGGLGSPGGSLGGISLPGRRGKAQNGPAETITGTLKRVSMAQFDLDPGDGRNITVSIERTTKFLNASAGSAKLGDFDIGDQVAIDYSRDNQNYYHAVRISLQQKAAVTSDQKSDRPTETANAPDAAAPRTNSSNSSSSSNDDPDRPRLTRARPAESASATPRPQITAGDPTIDPTNAAPLKPLPREADDPGPPKLRHGVPARIDNTPPAGSAEAAAVARPSIKAEETNGVTRRAAAPVVAPPIAAESPVSDQSAAPLDSTGLTSTDPVIMGAREATSTFTETLPNYVVKQFTTRYQTDSTHGNRTAWQALDVVTADVVCEGGKESYKNILVNGKAPKDPIEKTGSWSTGEFAAILQAILAPYTDADFRGKRSTTIVNRPAFRYDFTVEQPRSAWHVITSSQSYTPGYTGSLWIDKENFRVLRIEMLARNMPKEFPLDQVESSVDYDYVLIGAQKYLLPVHSEALSCVRGTSDCTRNTIDFRNYKKFGADTSIQFDKN
ncbi:MAG: hypothetical protein ABJC09_10370 [Terriglobia bacterium]